MFTRKTPNPTTEPSPPKKNNHPKMLPKTPLFCTKKPPNLTKPPPSFLSPKQPPNLTKNRPQTLTLPFFYQKNPAPQNVTKKKPKPYQNTRLFLLQKTPPLLTTKRPKPCQTKPKRNKKTPFFIKKNPKLYPKLPKTSLGGGLVQKWCKWVLFGKNWYRLGGGGLVRKRVGRVSVTIGTNWVFFW